MRVLANDWREVGRFLRQGLPDLSQALPLWATMQSFHHHGDGGGVWGGGVGLLEPMVKLPGPHTTDLLSLSPLQYCSACYRALEKSD